MGEASGSSSALDRPSALNTCTSIAPTLTLWGDGMFDMDLLMYLLRRCNDHLDAVMGLDRARELNQW